MNPPYKYEIIRNSTLEGLQAEILNRMAVGWLPDGHIVETNSAYYHAMILESTAPADYTAQKILDAVARRLGKKADEIVAHFSGGESEPVGSSAHTGLLNDIAIHFGYTLGCTLTNRTAAEEEGIRKTLPSLVKLAVSNAAALKKRCDEIKETLAQVTKAHQESQTKLAEARGHAPRAEPLDIEGHLDAIERLRAEERGDRGD